MCGPFASPSSATAPGTLRRMAEHHLLEDEPIVDDPVGGVELHDPAVVSTSADSLIDGLGARRDELAAEKVEDLPVPGYDERLWASFRLPGAAETIAMARQISLAGKAEDNRELVGTALRYLTRPLLGVFLRDADGRRVDFPGYSEDSPAPLAALPERLVPPRPGGRAHTAESRLRALLVRDEMVVGFALALVGWAQGGQRQVAEDFAGE